MTLCKIKSTSLPHSFGVHDRMDELIELSNFFPYRIIDPELNKYFIYQIEHVQSCYDNNLYSSAFTHLHLIYMLFIYIQLNRIIDQHENEYKFFCIGAAALNGRFKKPSHPFEFSLIKESDVFNIFKIIGFSDELIGELKKPVRLRNDSLHANGKILVSEEGAFLELVEQYNKCMRTIINNLYSFIEQSYAQILLELELDDDYTLSLDDIETYFHELSIYELRVLTKDKSDKYSQFITRQIT